MATNVKSIAELLTSAGLRFQLDEARQVLHTGFETEFYRRADASTGISIMIMALDNGNYVGINAHWVYKCQNPAYYPVVTQACNEATRGMKMVRFQLDPADGEVSIVVQIPLMDAVLTERQLMTALTVIPAAADQYHHMVSTAVETGELVPPEDPNEVRRAFEEFMRARRSVRPTPVGVGLDE